MAGAGDGAGRRCAMHFPAGQITAAQFSTDNPIGYIFLTPIDPARTNEILMPHPLHHSIFRWPASLHPGHQRRRAAAATGGRRTSRLPPPHASLRGPCRPNQSRSSIPGGAARLEGARAGSAAPSGGCLWLAATVAACPATSSATSSWYPTPPLWPRCLVPPQ